MVGLIRTNDVIACVEKNMATWEEDWSIVREWWFCHHVNTPLLKEITKQQAVMMKLV